MSVESRYLECAHCHCEFLASERQVRRARSKEFCGRVYCSSVCHTAGAAGQKKKPYPFTGTCANCGKLFGSHKPKKYCSIECYSKSRDLAAELARNPPKVGSALAIKLTGMPPKPKVEYECLNCGLRWFGRPSRPRRFCCHPCYRKYMAQRFDRWIANPQNIALPQSFDEFMTQDKLPCLIEGCGWEGRSLGRHVSYAHGIPAAEFKRAAGFNLRTGLVTQDLFEVFSRIGTGNAHLDGSGLLKGHPKRDPLVREYRSLESREHMQKSLLLAHGTSELVPRVCRNCGKEYQATAISATTARYCSIECRTKHLIFRRTLRLYTVTCVQCHAEFQGSRYQFLRYNRNRGGVLCSDECRSKARSLAQRMKWEAKRGGPLG